MGRWCLECSRRGVATLMPLCEGACRTHSAETNAKKAARTSRATGWARMARDTQGNSSANTSARTKPAAHTRAHYNHDIFLKGTCGVKWRSLRETARDSTENPNARGTTENLTF